MDRVRRRRRWRPSGWSIGICLVAAVSGGVLLYPATASWLNSYQQSLIIRNAIDQQPSQAVIEREWSKATAYNDALVAGVALEAGGTVPVGFGADLGQFGYRDTLRPTGTEMMSRIKIDKIGVDLPVFHGTDHDTLLKGAGHLEGSHLPVGGESTRAVITAHRGLASATMFSDLDDVSEDDIFSVTTLGQVLTYRVVEVKVIDPDEAETLRAVPGRDLVTLVTCTPLGINSHRIVVTGERVTPNPPEIEVAGSSEPTEPGFPWWAIGALFAFAAIAGYLIRGGFVDARAQSFPLPDSSRCSPESSSKAKV